MNKKSLVFSSIVAALSLVSLILLFVPLMSGENLEEFGFDGGKCSLFAFGNAMKTLMAGTEAAAMGLIFSLPNILVCAISAGILLFAALSILTACNVIKSTKAAKAFRIVEIILASFAILFTAVLALVYMMMTSQMGLKAGAAALFPVMAIAMVVFASIDLHVVKKAARQAAVQA